jgi:hypothetical protein
MRRSLLDYMDSKPFKPRASLNAEAISSLIAKPGGAAPY